MAELPSVLAAHRAGIPRYRCPYRTCGLYAMTVVDPRFYREDLKITVIRLQCSACKRLHDIQWPLGAAQDSVELAIAHVGIPQAPEETEATIFDDKTFTLVCPRCTACCKLDDAIDRDSGCSSDPCHSVKVVCPNCKLEATL